MRQDAWRTTTLLAEILGPVFGSAILLTWASEITSYRNEAKLIANGLLATANVLSQTVLRTEYAVRVKTRCSLTANNGAEAILMNDLLISPRALKHSNPHPPTVIYDANNSAKDLLYPPRYVHCVLPPPPRT